MDEKRRAGERVAARGSSRQLSAQRDGRLRKQQGGADRSLGTRLQPHPRAEEKPLGWRPPPQRTQEEPRSPRARRDSRAADPAAPRRPRAPHGGGRPRALPERSPLPAAPADPRGERRGGRGGPGAGEDRERGRGRPPEQGSGSARWPNAERAHRTRSPAARSPRAGQAARTGSARVEPRRERRAPVRISGLGARGEPGAGCCAPPRAGAGPGPRTGAPRADGTEAVSLGEGGTPRLSGGVELAGCVGV